MKEKHSKKSQKVTLKKVKKTWKIHGNKIMKIPLITVMEITEYCRKISKIHNKKIKGIVKMKKVRKSFYSNNCRRKYGKFVLKN